MKQHLAFSNPKQLFLMDGLGAFLTALLLFTVLRPLDEFIGLPRPTLVLLSVIALALCIYSLCCCLFVQKNWRPFLQAISIANLLYCILSSGCVIYYFPQLTRLGLAYFLVEIAIVAGLACFEMYVVTLDKRRDFL